MQQVNWRSIGTPSRKILAEAVFNGLRSLYQPIPQNLHEWAEDNYWLSKESSSIEGPWRSLPTQKGVMIILSMDGIEVITVKKAARTGYTKICNAFIAYNATHKKRSGVVYQPTDDDRDSYVKDEIDPMLRDVKALRALFPWYNKRSSKNTIKKKTFIGSVWDFLGAKSPKNFRRLTKDVVIYDETDGCDHNIGGEGSLFKLGDTRLTTSSFPKSVRGSTPKLEKTSQIHKSFLDADLQLQFYVVCPHKKCGHSQPLLWGGVDADFGLKWEEDGKNVHYECAKCHKPWYFKQLNDLLESGRWQSAGGVWLDAERECFRDAKGHDVETPEHVAIHWPSWYSPFTPWEKLVREYLEANKKAKTGDTSDLITFVNTKMGEVWKEDVGEQIEWEMLYARREHYEAQVPDEVLFITAGCDTQDDRIELEILGWGLGEASWSIAYYVIEGDPAKPTVWKKVANLLHGEYYRASGEVMNVSVACIDSGGHYTDEVYAFSRKMGINFVYPIKGANMPGKPIAVLPRKPNRNRVKLVEVGTENAKELAYSRLRINEPGPGYCHFPVDEAYSELYFKGLTVEYKILKYNRGRAEYRWHCPPGRRNEPTDCRAYNIAALRLAQQKGVRLEDLHEERLSASTGTSSKQEKLSSLFAPSSSKPNDPFLQ